MEVSKGPIISTISSGDRQLSNHFPRGMAGWSGGLGAVHLLERVHPSGQHVQVIERGDGGSQVTLGVVQLFDVAGDLFDL